MKVKSIDIIGAIVRFKLNAAGRAIDMLPYDIRSKARELRSEILACLIEGLTDCLKEGNQVKKETVLKKIELE